MARLASESSPFPRQTIHPTACGVSRAAPDTVTVKLTPDKDDGGYVVTCRDLPEAITQGDTREEALSEAADCLAFSTPKAGSISPLLCAIGSGAHCTRLASA